jgi:hypothetical protein
LFMYHWIHFCMYVLTNDIIENNDNNDTSDHLFMFVFILQK